MTEFELIARWFARPAATDERVVLGIGDDCALLAPRPGRELAISTDMLVAGRHFFVDADPESLGWKTLAVNLSDLAAMGARPIAFTLALALPEVDAPWLDGFASGLFACADRFDCALVGGDTTRGPLNLCVTVFGDVATGRALRRDGARAGDDVWVSGRVGDAALALHRLRTGDAALDAALRDALERPMPAIALGLALKGLATSAIDVSDGLAQDLRHILDGSTVGASIEPTALPISQQLASADEQLRLRCALAGGDDYVLCFTAPASRRDDVQRAADASATRVTRLGRIEAEPGLRYVTAAGMPFAFASTDALQGYDHFA